MSWFRSQFLKVVEYKNDSNNTIVYRYPMEEKAEFMKNSKVVVREGQNAIFVHKGQVADLFTAGTHNLTTANIPVLTTLASWKYFFETPIKAEVYYINMTQFTDEKWGTTNPIIVRDADFGMVRIRGFGKYSFRVSDPKLFLKELFGTNASYTREDISSYLRSILISALTDTIAESKIPVLDLAANTLEFNLAIKGVIDHKFQEMGLTLVNFFIENISVPKEVEEAMDTRSSMGVMNGKMNEFIQYQAGLGIRDAAQNEGGGMAGAGVGLGAGMGMGQLFSNAFSSGIAPAPTHAAPAPIATIPCDKCGIPNAVDVKFCSNCGDSMARSTKACPTCKATLEADDKFCGQCGFSFSKKTCPKCNAELDNDTKFCPDCGEKI